MKPNSLAPLFSRRPTTLYARFLKRPVDVCSALLLLIFLFPLLLLIALLLILVQGGNPIFVQQRIGRHCRPFNIIKFRTMSYARGEDGKLLPDEARTTWVGKVLRASSLDELPELLNVLKGDMSFIGPRPWMPEKLVPFTQATRMKRMSVRPGISGLAQILGRNHLSYRQRVCYDLRYIRNLNAWLDFRILFYTVYKVAMREGLYESPGALGKPACPASPKDSQTVGKRANKPENEE